MKKTDVIRDQLHSANIKTEKLLSDISADHWNTTPEILNTNVNWQIGHIILANYLHGIASISGVNQEFRNMINVSDYIKFYGPQSHPLSFINEKPSQETLLDVYHSTLRLILKGIEGLKENELDEQTAVPNPSAKTKYEALLWMGHHQSWHNGQIALLKRVLSKKNNS